LSLLGLIVISDSQQLSTFSVEIVTILPLQKCLNTEKEVVDNNKIAINKTADIFLKVFFIRLKYNLDLIQKI
jgi:hypothetical protein